MLCLCLTGDREPEADSSLCTNVSMVNVAFCKRQSKWVFSSTKFHSLPQQDLRTYCHKHKGVTLEHILSEVK